MRRGHPQRDAAPIREWAIACTSYWEDIASRVPCALQILGPARMIVGHMLEGVGNSQDHLFTKGRSQEL